VARMITSNSGIPTNNAWTWRTLTRQTVSAGEQR
jgi:hypothetical protein